VLTSVLPRGAQFRPDEVEYRTMADEWVLSLHYRDGRIEKATAGSAIMPEHLERIQAEIARVLGSPDSTKLPSEKPPKPGTKSGVTVIVPEPDSN
jgi:hypothetical protein